MQKSQKKVYKGVWRVNIDSSQEGGKKYNLWKGGREWFLDRYIDLCLKLFYFNFNETNADPVCSLVLYFVGQGSEVNKVSHSMAGLKNQLIRWTSPW